MQRIDEIRPEDLADFPEFYPPTFAHPHLPSAESIRNRARISYRNLYEDAGRACGLSEEKLAQLVAMLIDQHVEALAPEVPDDLEGDQIREWFHAMDVRHRQEMRDLLGAEGVAAIESYRRRSIDQRLEVEDMREALDDAGLAISESQRRRMVRAVLEPNVLLPGREYTPSEQIEAVRQEVRARVEQNDVQLLAMARNILTNEQWSAYADYLGERRADRIDYETPDFARVEDDER